MRGGPPELSSRGAGNAVRRAAGTLLVLVLLLAAAPAVAAEVIRSWTATIAVYVTGNVFVSETLEVVSEGREIRHGIFRDLDFPQQDLQVLRVTRNGVDEPFSLEPNGRITRIRIGDAAVLLDAALHRYEIGYVVMNAAGGRRFGWDVTGVWPFPIGKVSATVVVPESRPIREAAGQVACPCGAPPALDVAVTRPTATSAVLAPAGELPPGNRFVVTVDFAPVPRTGKLDKS